MELVTVNYEGNDYQELVGLATLKTLPSSKSFNLKNDNKTEYRKASIEFRTPDGHVTVLPTQIFAKSIESMEDSGNQFEIGQDYLTSIRGIVGDNGQPLFFARTSHSQVRVAAEAKTELTALLGLTANVKASDIKSDVKINTTA